MFNDPGGRGGGEALRAVSGVATGLTPGKARATLSTVAPARPDDLAGLTLELSLLKDIKAKQGKDQTAFSVWKHGQVAQVSTPPCDTVSEVARFKSKVQTGGMPGPQFNSLGEREQCALLNAEIARQRVLLQNMAKSPAVNTAHLAPAAEAANSTTTTAATTQANSVGGKESGRMANVHLCELSLQSSAQMNGCMN